MIKVTTKTKTLSVIKVADSKLEKKGSKQKKNWVMYSPDFSK